MRHLTPVLFAASTVVLSTPPAQADLGDQLAKILADDGAAGEHFGYSSAMSGSTAIVGAHLDEDNGLNSGSAYLFDSTTGRQIAKLLANDGVAGDHFGWSVAIIGRTVIVGAVFDGDGGNFFAGSAYLFDTITGQQIAKLLPKDGVFNDYFGWSVGVSGNIAIVGAPFENDNGAEAGSAYLFDTTIGGQIAKLLANDGDSFDNFGISVAISGPPGKEIAIVGAHQDDDNGTSSGSAYLFDATTGRQIVKLLANDGAKYDHFGRSVAIDGGVAIVGADGDDDNGTDSGSAYLFDTTTGRQVAKLLPSNGAALDHFGRSVAICNETAVVGAYADDDNGGNSDSAYLFDITTGQQIVKLLSNDGAAGDEFGRSVAISGAPGQEVALVGAWRDDDNGFDTGSAYFFVAAGTPGTCPWDVNSDGVVNHHDIVEVVHNLGVCDDPDNCPWDVNGDGTVNGRDVAAVATHFGLCP